MFNQGSIHTTLEEFENGGFTLKTHQMSSVDHTSPEEFKKRDSHRSF